MIPAGWTCNEEGWYWYTHSTLGRICYDSDGWYWYPNYAEDEVKHRQGPFRLLREAVQAAERGKRSAP